MQTKLRWLGMVFILLATSMLVGCGDAQASVDRAEAEAQATRPAATEVVAVSIPHDPSLPTWLVVVEPFIMAASGVTSGVAMTGSSVVNPGEQIGPGVSAQLISALRQVGNVVVIDYTSYRQNQNADNQREGEVGPFLVKGTVTEFSETSDISSHGESRGPNIGLSMVPYVGGILAYGHGTKASSETKRTGMVGFDVQIIDPLTGRLITSFRSEGSFTSIGAMVTRTRWGKTTTSTEYGASAIGQAQRIALNQTVTQIHQTLAAHRVLAKVE